MNEANYDESLVPEYELPDPLIANDGSAVSTADDWPRRRAEILSLFETHVYGKTPDKVIDTRVVTLSEVAALEGRAKRKEVRIYFTESDERPYLDLLIYLPMASKGPVPGFVGLSFQGNHSITPETDVILSDEWMRLKGTGVVYNRATDDARGAALVLLRLQDAARNLVRVIARRESADRRRSAAEPARGAGVNSPWMGKHNSNCCAVRCWERRARTPRACSPS